jgi:hypothetical protein
MGPFLRLVPQAHIVHSGFNQFANSNNKNKETFGAQVILRSLFNPLYVVSHSSPSATVNAGDIDRHGYLGCHDVNIFHVLMSPPRARGAIHVTN